MDYTELSLGPSAFVVAERKNSPMLELEENPSRKRKYPQQNNFKITESLVLKDTYRSDSHHLQWEEMYNTNKNTMMTSKNYNWPKQQKLDLELNISSNSSERKRSSEIIEDLRMKNSSSTTNMVAMGCFKCNLLVMLSKSFPSCPNCKYVHSLSTDQHNPLPKMAKSFDTLSLLN